MPKHWRKVLALVAVLGSSYVGWRVMGPAGPPASGLVAAGQSAVFDFTYEASHSDQALGSTPLGGDLRLRGTLRLSDYGLDEAGDRRMGLALVSLGASSLTMLGQDVLANEGADKALLGHEMIACLSPSGEVRRLGAAETAPPLFRHLARAILLDLQVAVDSRSRWTSLERTPRGVAPTSYGFERRDGRLLVDKWRETYTRLDALEGARSVPHAVMADGAFHFELDAERAMVSMHGRETVLAEDAAGEPLLTLFCRIDLTRISSATAAGAPLAPVTAFFAAGDLQRSADADIQALRLQVGDLRAADILAQVRAVNLGGVIPNQDDWFWRATGYLELEPSFSRELVALFGAAQTKSPGRAFILSLLVSAGHAEAQRALVEALASAPARSDKDYGFLLQHASLLRQPQPEVIAFLQTRLAEETGRTQKAAALALGAVVGSRLHENPDAETSAAHDILRQRLANADNGEDRAVFLRALGNVGSTDDQTTVAGYADEDNEEVRVAVATALRKLDNERSADVLFDLLDDDAPRVQSAAISALAGRSLEDRRLVDIDALVLANRLNDTNADQLVNLLVHGGAEQPLAKEIFRHILANDPKRSELAARLRVLLGHDDAALQ